MIHGTRKNELVLLGLFSFNYSIFAALRCWRRGAGWALGSGAARSPPPHAGGRRRARTGWNGPFPVPVPPAGGARP